MNNNAWFIKEKPLLSLQSMSGGAAGSLMQGATLPPKYVDEVFSSYPYIGTGSSQTFTNNINLSKGGLVWLKCRNVAKDHSLTDTERGVNKQLATQNNGAETSYSGQVTAFNEDGFTIGDNGEINQNTNTHIGWSFRERKKFFDIVTYTGTGANAQISHDLGSTPGVIIVKKYSAGVKDWYVYHRHLTADYYLELNETTAQRANNYSGTAWNGEPTSTYFTLGDSGGTNGDGAEYVAYLFAHHDGDGVFGPDENKDIIYCDYYTGNGSSTGPEVNIGWEPQWVLIKTASSIGNWRLYDDLRGIVTDGDDKMLRPDTNQTESTSDRVALTPTGFKLTNSDTDLNASGDTYVYMAIRRPDGYVAKPPSAGTGAFAMDTGSSSSNVPTFDATFPVDFALFRTPASTQNAMTQERLLGAKGLQTTLPDAAFTNSSVDWDCSAGWASGWASNYQAWMWKRGQGLDVVVYEGDGQSNRRVNHSLGRVPGMIWVKNIDTSRDWVVYHKGLNGGTNPQNYYLKLNTNDAEASTQYIWSEYAPTATQFEVDATGVVNDNNETYLALLFADSNDIDGNPISKCGYYTGNGTSGHEITTGFQPRFLIVKGASFSTDANWYMFDTLRGWAAGTEEILKINSDAAQYQWDYGAPTSTGFTLTTASGANSNNENFIYYAHA